MVVVTVSVLENVQIVSSTVQISCKLALAVLNTTLATSLDVSKEKILEKDHQIEALEARLSDLNPPPTLSPSPQMSLPPEKLPPGVSRHRTKYRARRKGQYLGVFDTIDKAQAAYEASAAYETSGNGGTAQGTQQNSVVPGGNVPGPSGTFQELSGTSGTTQGTSGPSGNEEGTGGNSLDPDDPETVVLDYKEYLARKLGPFGPSGNGEKPCPRVPIYPVSKKSCLHDMFYYFSTDEGLELVKRDDDKEECLGFFDTIEEVRKEIIADRVEAGSSLSIVAGLFDPFES